MRTFQAILVALSVAASQAGHVGHGGSQVAVAAAPAVAHVAAAPAYHSAPAQVQVGVVAHAPAQRVRTHEVHTSTGRQTIQLQEYQAGDQVIRVHEGPQAGPQVNRVVVPGEKHHVRVVNHASGPAHVSRQVHRQPAQVHQVQKPGRPGVRIVQVVRAQSPAPSVEFVSAGGSSHHVYHANDNGGSGSVGFASGGVGYSTGALGYGSGSYGYAAGSGGYGAAPVEVIAGPSYAAAPASYAAPVSYAAAAPVSYAAPATYAAPVQHAAVVSASKW